LVIAESKRPLPRHDFPQGPAHRVEVAYPSDGNCNWRYIFIGGCPYFSYFPPSHTDYLDKFEKLAKQLAATFATAEDD
jgi:hypothetical protein